MAPPARNETGARFSDIEVQCVRQAQIYSYEKRKKIVKSSAEASTRTRAVHQRETLTTLAEWASNGISQNAFDYLAHHLPCLLREFGIVCPRTGSK